MPGLCHSNFSTSALQPYLYKIEYKDEGAIGWLVDLHCLLKFMPFFKGRIEGAMYSVVKVQGF